MGCGCKSNQQAQQPTAQQLKEIEAEKLQANESIKTAIKKTVEKYYYKGS
jgi:hypothetical protein